MSNGLHQFYLIVKRHLILIIVNNNFSYFTVHTCKYSFTKKKKKRFNDIKNKI